MRYLHFLTVINQNAFFGAVLGFGEKFEGFNVGMKKPYFSAGFK